MRRFNPDRELNKIQHGNKNKILYGVILLLLIISIGSTYALYQVRYSKRIIYTKVAPFSNKDINILAIYLDDKLTDKFPVKGSKVVFDRVDCDNGSTGAFNTNTWKLILEAEGKDKCSVYFRTTTDYIDDSGANPPELYQGLIPVTFDSSGNMKVANLTENWYDYDEKRWANAVLVDNSKEEIKSMYFNEDGSLKTDIANKDVPMEYVLQMYVWIPRYKYQLFNVNNVSIQPREIKIEFESGTLSTGEVTCEISTTGVEICENDKNDKWYTHPAFNFGNSTKKEENTQLKGIWVGKFEPSHTTKSLGMENDPTAVLNCSNDNCAEAGSIRILPDKPPLRDNDTSNFFYVSRSIEKKVIYNLDSKQIDIHMMKNMEWGAMAYLTHSKYGRCTNGACTEVARNTLDPYSKQQCKTGYATQLWYTADGQTASTTGNMYGIYDTNGGSWEYMMAVLVDTSGSNTYFSNGGFSAETMPNEKYYDLYQDDASSWTTHQRGHLGDATRETLTIFGNATGGWYGDYSYFPNASGAWFARGGRAGDGSLAGTFAFQRPSGASGGRDFTFRIVLTAEDK